MITLGTLRFVQVTTCHANLLKQKQDMSHEQANFQNSLFCSCLLSGRITTAINTANDYTDDVLQNGFGTNPVWLIREKVMSASSRDAEWSEAQSTLHKHASLNDTLHRQLHPGILQCCMRSTSSHHSDSLILPPTS